MKFIDFAGLKQYDDLLRTSLKGGNKNYLLIADAAPTTGDSGVTEKADSDKTVLLSLYAAKEMTDKIQAAAGEKTECTAEYKNVESPSASKALSQTGAVSLYNEISGKADANNVPTLGVIYNKYADNTKWAGNQFCVYYDQDESASTSGQPTSPVFGGFGVKLPYTSFSDNNVAGYEYVFGTSVVKYRKVSVSTVIGQESSTTTYSFGDWTNVYSYIPTNPSDTDTNHTDEDKTVADIITE